MSTQVVLVLYTVVWLVAVAGIIWYCRQRLRVLYALAYRNPVTGLPNRRAFDGSMRMLYDRHRSERSSPLTVAYLDLDEFKAVNDSAGHEVGDVVLRVIGELLCQNLRATDVKLHVGGDEFVLFLPDMDKVRTIEKLCSIRALLSAALDREGIADRVSFTFGVASSPPCEPADVVREAEKDMYFWKERRHALR